MSRDVKGTCPEITFEFRSHVADGFSDTPTELLFRISEARSSRTGEVSGSERLEESAAQGELVGM